MTLNEAAEILKVQPAVLRQQIAKGKLRATKKGRDWFVTPAAVRAYDEQRQARKP